MRSALVWALLVLVEVALVLLAVSMATALLDELLDQRQRRARCLPPIEWLTAPPELGAGSTHRL